MPSPSSLETLPSRLGVTRFGGEFKVIACHALEGNEIVLHMEGRLRQSPSRYTVQIDAHSHLDPWEGKDLEWVLDHRPYAFLNHSCRPNARIVSRDVITLRPIAAGEEVTFDYRTTERTLDAPFPCRCGHCDGAWIRGYSALDPAEFEALLPLLGEHARAELLGRPKRP